MIDALFGNSNYLAAKKMLDANVLRHEAIASNLANIETPNYKRLDVSPSFESQLQQAVASKDPEQLAALQPALTVDPQAVSTRGDGNTVQLETELLKAAKGPFLPFREVELRRRACGQESGRKRDSSRHSL